MKEVKEVSASQGNDKVPGVERFMKGVKAGEQITGNFREAWPITEAVNLYSAALRANKTLFYDGDKMKITNDDDANKYLTREYRPGWKLEEM